MNASIKGLLAGIATVAVIGTAIAQGTPPTNATSNPAIGAGQQSSQGTPMGTTGTPATSSSGNMAAPSAPSAPMTSGNTGMASDTTTATPRTMRADRN